MREGSCSEDFLSVCCQIRCYTFVLIWCDDWLLPFDLPILMPVLCKKSSDLASTQAGYEEDTRLQTTVCHWLTQPLAGEPLVALQAGPTTSDNIPPSSESKFLAGAVAGVLLVTWLSAWLLFTCPSQLMSLTPLPREKVIVSSLSPLQ